MKWAREHGYPWSPYTCMCAAKNGHLEILKWARENGAPWDDSTRRIAVSKGYVET